MTSPCCNVIGAGGHGKVIVGLLKSLGWQVPHVYDDDPGLWGTRLSGISVTGPICSIADAKDPTAILAVGENSVRKSFATQLDLDWVTIVHPTAYVDATASLGPGTVVLPNATVHVGAKVGQHVIVNSSATVEHDCTLEDYCHVAPGCSLAGAVHVCEGALLGVGSCSIVGRRIGEWATVGAGAVVTSNIPAHSTVVGVPARPIHRLNNQA